MTLRVWALLLSFLGMAGTGVRMSLVDSETAMERAGWVTLLIVFLLVFLATWSKINESNR